MLTLKAMCTAHHVHRILAALTQGHVPSALIGSCVARSHEPQIIGVKDTPKILQMFHNSVAF